MTQIFSGMTTWRMLHVYCVIDSMHVILSLAMVAVTLLHVYCFIESMVSSLYPSIFKSNQGMQPGMTGPTGSGWMIMGGSSRTGCWAHTFFYNSQASNQHSRP